MTTATAPPTDKTSTADLRQQAVAALIAMLEKPGDPRRPDARTLQAIKTLSALGDPSAIQPILAHIGSDMSIQDSQTFITALAAFGAAAFDPVMAAIEATSKRDPSQRHSLLYVLKKIATLEHLGQLKALWERLSGDSGATEMSILSNTLKRLGWQPTEINDRVRFYAALGEWDAIQALGETALPQLMRLTHNQFIRRDVVKVIQSISTDAYITYLLLTLNDKNNLDTIEALGRVFKPPQTVWWVNHNDYQIVAHPEDAPPNVYFDGPFATEAAAQQAAADLRREDALAEPDDEELACGTPNPEAWETFTGLETLTFVKYLLETNAWNNHGFEYAEREVSRLQLDGWRILSHHVFADDGDASGLFVLERTPSASEVQKHQQIERDQFLDVMKAILADPTQAQALARSTLAVYIPDEDIAHIEAKES